MLTEEPSLQFIAAQHIADDQVVGAGIAQRVRTFGQLAAVADNDLMSVEKTGKLHWHCFPAPRRSRDARGFRHISRHRNRNSAKQLNPLGDGVDDFRLFSEMLIE